MTVLENLSANGVGVAAALPANASEPAANNVERSAGIAILCTVRRLRAVLDVDVLLVVVPILMSPSADRKGQDYRDVAECLLITLDGTLQHHTGIRPVREVRMAHE
ncbi:hypothetical protein QNA15_06935 [Rhodococcus fascians]|nr:hypothetical protein [Rhodococcus fascians]MDJ0409232.1 hypothetical protein [Rhodococcus fascians]